jgi:hypothetical protein
MRLAQTSFFAFRTVWRITNHHLYHIEPLGCNNFSLIHTIHKNLLDFVCTLTDTVFRCNFRVSTLAMSLHNEDYRKLNWEATGGKLVFFDDGHIPEMCRKSLSSSSSTPSGLVHYPDLFQRAPHQVRVYTDCFAEDLVDSIYQKTLDGEHPTWGDYLTIKQIKRYWKTRNATNDNSDTSTNANSLLIQLVARYLELSMRTEDSQGVDGANYTNIGRPGTLFTPNDLEHVHGVAVWGLRSGVGSEVDTFICDLS